MMKKAWRKPVLIILVRGKPEESVLSACKGNGSLAVQNAQSGCEANPSGACSMPCPTVANS